MMKNLVTAVIVILAQNQVIAPLNYYNKEKYEQEDRLIKEPSAYWEGGRHANIRSADRGGEAGTRTSRNVFTDSQLESPVMVQALNFRLPQMPVRAPSLPSNFTMNIYAVQG